MLSGDEIYGDEITSPTLDDQVASSVPPTFQQWMIEVDDILAAACGLTSDDLPDQLYRDAYDEDVSAEVFCEETFGIVDGQISDWQTWQEANS